MKSLAESPVPNEKKKKLLKLTASSSSTEAKNVKRTLQKQSRETAANQTSSSETKSIHMSAGQFGGMRAECIDDDFLYRVSHAAGDLLESASLVIRESGIKIQTTDPQSIAVVLIDLPAKMFSSYRCEGHIVAHVNMETLVGMLKKTSADNAKFKVALEIRADNPETMYITIYDTKKGTTTEHILTLWEPKDLIIYFDDAQFDYCHVVSSRGWHEEISDLSHLVDPDMPIRICAGNDLKLSIDGDYGESSTIFKQGKTPGYKVVEKCVDPTATDSDGNYLFFNEIEGLAPPTSNVASEGKVGRKRKAPKEKEKVKRRRDGDSDDDAEEEEEVAANEEESVDFTKLQKFSKPIIENQDDSKLVEEHNPIKDVKLTLSLLLVRMVSKGLRQSPELYLLFKKNYPVMFVQRMKMHGHILIAISPTAMDGDENANNDEEETENAMNQLMALGKE